MEYTVNRTLGLCADFSSAFVFATDTPERLFGLKFSAETEKIRERLRSCLLGVNDAFSLLVNPDMRLCYMSCVERLIKIGDIKSLDGYIEMLFGCTDEEFAARCLFCFNNGTGKYEDCLALIGNRSECVTHIRSMNIGDESKILLFSMLVDTAGYRAKANELAQLAKRLVLEIHKEYEARIEEVFRQYYDREAITGFLNGRKLTVKNDSLVIEPTFINPLWMYYGTEAGTTYCRIGYETVSRADEVFGDIQKPLTTDDIGRLFSDKTRCDALRLLTKRDYYQVELAKALGISANTMFYHLQLMNDAGLVSGRIEGRKCYYCLNRSYFEAVKAMADKIISEIDEKVNNG